MSCKFISCHYICVDFNSNTLNTTKLSLEVLKKRGLDGGFGLEELIETDQYKPVRQNQTEDID